MSSGQLSVGSVARLRFGSLRFASVRFGSQQHRVIDLPGEQGVGGEPAPFFVLDACRSGHIRMTRLFYSREFWSHLLESILCANQTA
jgi:hypothetical protein